MKVLVIPDIHGSTYWKKNFLDNVEKVSKVVFLGDYVDSFNENEKGEVAAKNFEDIIQTTEKYKEKVDILLGNHDISYIYQFNGDPNVSGHQPNMAIRYNDIFVQNKDRIKIVVKYGKWVFSHAGFSRTWCRNTINYFRAPRFKNIKLPTNPVGLANWLWEHEDISTLNFSDMCLDSLGDSIYSSPLWIRPNALLTDAYYLNQIIGHTEVKTEKPLILKHKKNTLVLTDSMMHDRFLIVDTNNNDFEKSCVVYNV